MNINSPLMSRTKLTLGLVALLFVCVIGLFLLLIGESVAVSAALLVLLSFLPVYLVAKWVNSFVLKALIGIALVTQTISVPLFVIHRDAYASTGWNAVKDFTFTFGEFVPMYTELAFFLIVVVSCVALFINVFKFPKLRLDQSAASPVLKPATTTKGIGYYLFLLILALILMTPLNLWMFSNGISLTGVEPPRLPFRLSGILHYLTSLVVPVVLAAIYAKTSRSYSPAIFLMLYAFVLGATQVSKGALLLVMLPILYFAVVDRRYVLLSLSAAFTLVAVQLVILLRNVVYVVTAGKSGADSEGGLMMTLDKMVNEGFDNFSITDTFLLIVDRIEGAQQIILASKFNADAIGGVTAAFQWFNFNPWNVFDANTYHMELIGITLPEGFVAGGGGLLSKALLVTQSEPLFIAAFAINVAAYILIGEWIARSICIKYAVPTYYYIVGGVYVLFFYVGSGTLVFLAVLSFLIFIVLMPKMSVRGFGGKKEIEQHTAGPVSNS
ncbi:MAG: hypothetical protein HZB47_07940 [Nitrosomonadales bacterium]|nr:hypothetical protein [Nitrosomonadales bacterium]